MTRIDLTKLDSFNPLDYKVGQIGTCSCGGTKFTTVEETYESAPDKIYLEQVCDECLDSVAMEELI